MFDANNERRFRGWVLLAFMCAVTATGALCAWAALAMWPIVDGDGVCHFPATVEWGRGHPLTNPLWLTPLDETVDGPGGRRYIYHGFLYPLVTGSLARALGGGAEGAVHAAYVIHWLAAVACSGAVLLWARPPGLWRVALALILPPSMLALSHAMHGRHEPLILVLIGVLCASWRWLKSPMADAFAGVVCAFCFFTSPAIGVLGMFATLGAIVLYPRRGSIAPRFAAAAAGALAAAALCVAIYPYPVADWVGGVRRLSRIYFNFPMFNRFVATWLARPTLPLLLLLFSTLAVLAGRSIAKQTATLDSRRRWVVGLLALAFCLGLARVSGLKTEAYYNAVVWVPLLACIALATGSRLRAGLVLAVLMLPVAGISRSALMLRAQSDPSAPTFEDVRATIERLEPQGCAISPGLWIAAVGENVHFFGADSAQPRYLLLNQTNTGHAEPPPVPNYKLVENHFGAPVRFLGVPISHTGGGWHYAVYERR